MGPLSHGTALLSSSPALFRLPHPSVTPDLKPFGLRVKCSGDLYVPALVMQKAWLVWSWPRA